MAKNEQLKQYVIPFGTSEPQDFELRDLGLPIDGSGFTVELVIEQLVDGGLQAVDGTLPTADWLSEDDGTVRVDGVENLAVGNYLVRFKVTDEEENIGFFPNGDKAYLWRVVPVSSR